MSRNRNEPPIRQRTPRQRQLDLVAQQGYGRHGMRTAAVAIILGLTAGLFATGALGQTLNGVRHRGVLLCGSNYDLVGFGLPDAQGNWTGLDVEFCRAIAAAIFDDPTKVRFVPLSSKDRFTALQSGEVDVLVPQLDRDDVARHPARPRFPGDQLLRRPRLHGPQDAWVSSAKELNGRSVCTDRGTTTELNLADYFRVNNLKYQAVIFATADEAIKHMRMAGCDALTTDASGLYAERLRALEPGRSHRSAGDHLQGAAWPGGPPGRQPVGRHRPLGSHTPCSMPRNSA